MIRRAVVSAPEAEADLLDLFLAAEASPAIGITFMRRLRAWLDDVDLAAERGTRRDDIRRGLRTIGFERRVTATFALEDERVVIQRLFYGGQDWGAVLAEP